jgi:predicted pyridoxine 5'-phosphate oxidase superfamily flavin-nucleotide-binding protein
MRHAREPSASCAFHEGELAVQRRAGVEDVAARLSGMLATPSLDGGIGRFLAGRTFATLTARDREGRLWISPLVSAPGFLDGTGSHLTIRAGFGAADPLRDLPVGQPVGLLAMDFGRRRRVRVNGTLTAAGTAGLEVEIDQAYGNCPQYIQQRLLDRVDEPPPQSRHPGRRARALTDADRTTLRRADTFFLGTSHPGRGADASHRGGNPGFIRVDDDRLWWPDYPGNNLFNSMGNLAVDDTGALLVIDFDRGATLHLSGRATVDWTEPGSPGDDGHTGRRVWFTPSWIVAAEGLPLHAECGMRPSPVNPPVAPASPDSRPAR